MAEENIKSTSVSTDNAAKEVSKVEAPLITRVSQFKPQEPVVKEPSKEVSEEKFDVTDIDKIVDPNAKEYAQKAYKSFERGYNKKFMELAEQRKALESQTNWTPERVQSLLNDANFVAAAQKIIPQQTKTEEDYSVLSDSEKAKLSQMEDELMALKHLNNQTLTKQQDDTLKNKYANYASDIVDTTISKLQRAEVIATREDIWKVVDYDDAVQRAYKLGLADRTLTNTEKLNSSSIEGTQARTQREEIKPDEGESDQKFFKRIFLNNLAKKNGRG